MIWAGWHRNTKAGYIIIKFIILGVTDYALARLSSVPSGIKIIQTYKAMMLSNFQGLFFLVATFSLVLVVIQKWILTRKQKVEIYNLQIDLEERAQRNSKDDLERQQLEEFATTLKKEKENLETERNKESEEFSRQLTSSKEQMIADYQKTINEMTYKLSGYDAKYGYFINAELEKERIITGLSNLSAEMSNLEAKYQAGKQILSTLEAEIDLYRDEIEMNAYGLYKPTYNFEFPEQYLIELEGIYDRQKAMVKKGTAAVCHTKWEISGSVEHGRRMIKDEIKLVLYAFNGECDAIVAKVSWNNAAKSRERILKAFHEINNLGSIADIEIDYTFYQLKQLELSLVYEYERARHEKKEEQRVARELMREEERAQREFERAKEEAEEEAIMYK